MTSLLLALLAGVQGAACTEAPVPAAEGASGSDLMVASLSLPAARPWAAFVVATVPTGTLRCSGTLISPNLILTSADCTACSSSVSVGLLGESAFPGLPPLTFHGNAAGGISTEPGAFKSAPTCTGSPTDIAVDLTNKRIDGHALGLVRLASNVAITPAKVLLSPPLGFAPAQDLAGAQKITVVSGGTDLLFGGSYLMREAKFALQRYSNQFILPDCNPNATEPFTLQRWIEANVGALDGDDGGAWLATVNGSEQLIGVAQSTTFGLQDNAAPTFLLRNADFVRAALGQSIGATDSDGDEVADIADNCPQDANRDQIDRDNDTVGDVCDNCAPNQGNGTFLPGPLDTYDPAEGSFAQFANPDQANCNADAEEQAILAASPSTPLHLSDADYVASFGSALFSTCQSSPLGQLTKQRRGDACDPVPCARAKARAAQVTGGSFGTVALCAANGYAIGLCSYEATSGWDLQGTGQLATTQGSDGVRFCRCDLPHSSASLRRLFCAAGPAGCAIDPALYQLDHPKWKKLNLVGADGNGEKLSVFNFPSGSGGVDWNYLSDLTALTGTALPAQPWTLDDDGTIVGGPKLRGVLWSHVVSLGGQATSGLPAIDGRSVPGLASEYTAGDHHFIRRVRWKKIPRYKPHYWWEYCAMCGVRPDQQWLEVVNDASGAMLGVVALGLDGGTDVTGAVDRTAVAMLAAGTQINAAEPEATLRLAGIARRAVALRAGSLDVTGVLSNVEDRVVGAALTGTTTALAAGEATALAYSATRGELFAFRQVPGRVTALQRYSLSTQRWLAVRLSGAPLSTPLATAFSTSEQALYLLDRGAGTLVRLVRIGADDGVATVISSGLFDGSFSAMSLAFTASGALLAVGADGRLGQTDAAHLQLATAATPMMLIDRATLPREQMVGSAFESGAGVSFLVRLTDGHFEGRSIARASFVPVNLRVSGPVF